jgi:hypothetical protein
VLEQAGRNPLAEQGVEPGAAQEFELDLLDGGGPEGWGIVHDRPPARRVGKHPDATTPVDLP